MVRTYVAPPWIALSVLGALGCAPAFKDLRTPSGAWCADMPVIPAGVDPPREYHRLVPIISDAKAQTEAERLESLRRAACKAGGDAVIEAVNEEVRGPQVSRKGPDYVTVSSGTTVVWTAKTSCPCAKP